MARKPGASSWLSEYQRLHTTKKLRPWATLNVHADEVLHITFSHCGTYIVTSSRDKSVMIWNISKFASRSVIIVKKLSFEEWLFVQLSIFSEDDKFLLVSGVCERGNITGEVQVFSFPDCKFLKRVPCMPYDCFGAWLTNTEFLVGDFDIASHSACVTLHSVYDYVPSTKVLKHPPSNIRYPFNIKMFEVCTNPENNNEKLFFYLVSETTMFAHVGIPKSKL